VIRDLLRSPWIRGLLTALILLYLFSNIDLAEAAAAMLRLSATHALAVLALVAIDRAVMIARWVLLLKSSGSPVSASSAAEIYLVSSFVGSVLPAGVGADAVRSWTLRRRTAEGSEAVASVALDRVSGLLALVLLGALGMAMWSRRVDATEQTMAALAALLVTAATAAMLWSDVVIRSLVPRPWLATRPGGALLALVDAVGRYRGRRWVLATVLALSVFVQWLRIAQAWLLGTGIGIQVPPGYYLVFMPIGLLMLLLPVSISGFGLPQGVIVWLLQPQGVPDVQSFALSTLIILTGLVGNLPGLLLYLKSPTTRENVAP
jgi:uncharacterized membrane protein YbhN (UPF0104 family)